MAGIAAEAEASERRAELDQLAARFADTADARRQSVTLAQGDRPSVYGPTSVGAVTAPGWSGQLDTRVSMIEICQI